MSKIKNYLFDEIIKGFKVPSDLGKMLGHSSNNPEKKNQLKENSDKIKDEDLRKKTLENDNDKQNIVIRRHLSRVLKKISIRWLEFTAVLIILSGLNLCNDCFCIFEFSDQVLITIITSSLATVLALWTIALMYFFPKNKKKKED